MYITVKNKITKRGNESSLTSVKIDGKNMSFGEIPFTDKELIYLIKGLYEQREDLFEEVGLVSKADMDELVYDLQRRLDNMREVARDEMDRNDCYCDCCDTYEGDYDDDDLNEDDDFFEDEE